MSDASIAFPKAQTITVGSGDEKKDYTIVPFKMGKTLIILERISRLLEEEAVSEILTGGNLQATFFTKLPQLLATARPKLFELFGLILLSNRQVVTLSEDGKLDDTLTDMRKELEVTAETQDAFTILDAGIDAMGLDTIRGNITRLSEKFRTPSAQQTVVETVETKK